MSSRVAASRRWSRLRGCGGVAVEPGEPRQEHGTQEQPDGGAASGRRQV